MDYSGYLAKMKEAALLAGKMLLKEQGTSTEIHQSYKDFVTYQDLKAEKMISDLLSNTFTLIQPYGEEAMEKINPKSFPKKGTFWIIDPIDGTNQYFKGKEKWGVSIALVEDGVTVAAVVYLPATSQLFSASINSQTRLETGNPSIPFLIQITPEKDIRRCTFVIDYGKPGFLEPKGNPFYQTMEKLRRHNIHDDGGGTSSVFQMMNLVLGNVDACFFQPDHFDLAAAGLIVKQAGGRVTNFEGVEWQSFEPQVLASNGAIHDELLKIINEPL